MPKSRTAGTVYDDIVVPDAELLTPKELEQERKALAEERAKLAWVEDSPTNLARRIPVSVFAMGALVGL